jgi:hypothetical protein
MDTRLDNRNEPNPKRENSHRIFSTDEEKNQIPNKGTSMSSFFGMFRRKRSNTEDNTGFINKQIPAYWHEYGK